MTSIARFTRIPGGPNAGFSQIVGDATQLAMSSSGTTYALATDGTIWAGLYGDNWKLVRCDNVVFKKIFHGQEGVWALTADGSIYQSNDANDTMVRTDGSLRFISSPHYTNGGDTYGLNFENDLFCFRSPAWVPVATPPGVKFFTIAANTEYDPTFTTWALGVDGNTYRKDPSASDPAVNNFSMVPGPTFADIQVVTSEIWALAALPPNTLGDFPVYVWSPNVGWAQVQGEKLSSITVGGIVWGVNSFGQVRRFNDQNNSWFSESFLDVPAGTLRQPIGPIVSNDDATLVLFNDAPNIIP